MGEDAGVDRPGLLHLVAGGKILVDAIDTHRARIVERYQNILGGNVCADVYRARREPYPCTVRCQGASLRIDAKGGDVMLSPSRAVPGSAAAACDIKIASRCVRPGILHAGRKRDRLTLDQLRAWDIDVVMRKIGPNVCVERDPLGRRLRGSQSRRGNTTCDERKESSAAEHG